MQTRQSSGLLDGYWLTPSALLLVAANLLPVYGVLALGWSVFPVLLIFWFETVIVGAMSVLRMVFAYPASFLTWLMKLLFFPLMGFFLIPYVMLVGILSFFVFGLFANESVQQAFVSILFAASTASGLLPLDEAMRVMRSQFDTGMVVTIAALAASHLYSFVWHYLIKGECNRVTFGSLVGQPLARVWLMGAAVTVGMFGVQRLDAPLWLLVPLIGVKTALDLYAHLREHRAPQTV